LSGLHPAVFLDRDGTLIEDTGYLSDPGQVCLLPGSAETLRLLRNAGFRLVVVTNQSGVARGHFNEICLAAIHDRMRDLLAAQGVQLDGLYYCPYHPDGIVDAYRKDSDWRKPGPGMLFQAAGDLGLDLAGSWMIGDAPRDIQAGRRAGCRTVLLGAASDDDACGADRIAAGWCEAGRQILQACGWSGQCR
jgi:D-glycero-D-manno-heptose 1,7-bisphosphate phosphatase